jgi:hypothetical protein
MGGTSKHQSHRAHTDVQLALEQDIEAAKSGKPKGKAAIKAAAKKKKRAAGEDSDESDDFKPTKAKAVVKPKAAAKASPAKRNRSVTLAIKLIVNMN